MGIDARLLADVARKELLDGIGDGVRPDHPQTAKRHRAATKAILCMPQLNLNNGLFL
jgi:hypothetical protein